MKAVIIIKYLFTVLGIGMLAGALFMIQDTRSFIAGASRAPGTVIDLEESESSDSTTYRAVVRFLDARGAKIEFASSTSSDPPAYSVGEAVEVFYDPAAPQEAKINGFFDLWGGATILGSMGVVFFLVGGGIVLAGALKARRVAHLRVNGRSIEAEFQAVERNTSLRVNGKHPYRVLAQWRNPSTSEVHVFRSDNLWFDPSDFVKGRKIRVLIDKENPRKYHVELSFLPGLAK